MYYEHQVNAICSKVMPIFYLTQALYVDLSKANLLNLIGSDKEVKCTKPIPSLIIPCQLMI
jgi:hypothetical protein